MIQRIQSVYLLLSIFALGLTFFFPLMAYYGDLHTYQFNLIEMQNLVPNSVNDFKNLFTMPLLAVLGFILLLSILIIFKYRNRKLQLQLTRINMLLNLVLIIAIFFGYSRYIQSVIDVEEQFKTGAFFPLISLVFLVLAYRGIKKDDDLIRSTDRLR